MRKGIGPRGLGAVKSPAQQTKHDGSRKYQDMVEGKIRRQYTNELRAKENEIRNRTYEEAGFSLAADDRTRKSPEYQQQKNILDTRVSRRMMKNPGPNEIRTRRDSAIAESRATYEAMPQVQSRRNYNKAKEARLEEMRTKSKRAK
jgi:hypothetical protein